MKSIQIVLIALSILAAITGSIAFRSKLAYRLLAIFFFFVAVGFVMFPNSTSEIAQIVGVGRGTDLLLYLTIFAGVHSCLLLYMRTRRMERKFTDLVRGLAIKDAQSLSDTQYRSAAASSAQR
jgi:small membrane protein